MSSGPLEVTSSSRTWERWATASTIRSRRLSVGTPFAGRLLIWLGVQTQSTIRLWRTPPPVLLALALDSAFDWGITFRGHAYYKQQHGLQGS
jgi:hypothetical protein